jgi:sporulation protein YunB
MKVKQVLKLLKILLFLFIIIFIINFLSGYFSERVKTYVEQKAKLEAANILSNAISETVLPNIDLENLIKTTTVGTEIDSIYINTYQVNRIMAETTKQIQEELSRIENNEVLNNLELPLNIVISEIFFAGYGPKIDIDIFPVGSTICDVVTTFDNYGINNMLLEISIVAKVRFVTVIPLQRQEIEVETRIPIVVQVIQGKVPIYYYHNTDSEYLPNPVR